MSEVKLVIRDAKEDRSGTVHGSVAEWFIAALSADPVSIAELDAAVDRFALTSPDRGHLSCFRHWLDTEPWDAGLIVIDLAARLVMIDSTYSGPHPAGVVHRHNVESLQGSTVLLRYRLSKDWVFLSDAMSWEGTAQIRRQQRASQPQTNLREIFYGEPMLRFVINGCCRKFAHRDEIAERVHREWIERQRKWNERCAEEPQPDPETLTMYELSRSKDAGKDIEHEIYHDTIRDIHADWLMTPCAELNGQLPRTVMLHDRERLSGDMSDREEHWTILERCPPGISPESHAFQFSGFNTSEIVMYYSYVREVAWCCWDRLRSMSGDEFESLQTSQIKLDEFIHDEVIRLGETGERWLDSPWDGDPRRTPRGIINLERRRQPNGGQFHPIDSDCPCCRALAEMPGIGFWHLDGCNMDDLFAFAYYHDTIESWEKSQEEYREFDRVHDEEWRLAKEWNLPRRYSEQPSRFGDVWQLAVKSADGEIPLGSRLNQVGHETVSVVVQLEVAAEHDAALDVEQHIDALQLGFAQLRKACENSTEQELSPDVESNVTQLLVNLAQLLSDLEAYVGNDPEEIVPYVPQGEADGVGEFCEAETSNLPENDSENQPPGDFRWRKVLRSGRELRRLLRSFTEISKEQPYGDWSSDVPY